jgi:hypothetical protein
MNRRSNRRRARNAHNSRRDDVHLCDTITIDAAACRAILDGNDTLDDWERLTLLMAFRHGDGVVTFAEFKRLVHGAVLDAGSVEAAIWARKADV